MFALPAPGASCALPEASDIPHVVVTVNVKCVTVTVSECV